MYLNAYFNTILVPKCILKYDTRVKINKNVSIYRFTSYLGVVKEWGLLEGVQNLSRRGESAEGTDSIRVPGNDRRLVAVNLVLSHLHVTVNGTPLLSSLHFSPLLSTLPSAVFYLPFVFRPPRYVTMSKLIFFNSLRFKLHIRCFFSPTV